MYDSGRKDRGGRIVEQVAIAALTPLATLSVNDLYCEFQVWRKKQAKRKNRQRKEGK